MTVACKYKTTNANDLLSLRRTGTGVIVLKLQGKSSVDLGKNSIHQEKIKFWNSHLGNLQSLHKRVRLEHTGFSLE